MGAVEEIMCGCVLQRGNSGNGCELASTFCKCDLRKVDLFVLSWTSVQRVRRGSVFRSANVWWRYAQYFVISILWLGVYGTCLLLCPLL